MKLSFASERPQTFAADSVVFFVNHFDRLTDPRLRELDKATGGAVTNLSESGEFTAKEGEVTTFFRPEGYRADRVIAVGLGEKKKVDADSYRRAAGLISRYKSLTQYTSTIFHLGSVEDALVYQAVIEGYLLGSYKLLEFKSGEARKSQNRLVNIQFAIDNRRLLKRLQNAVQKGRVSAEGQLRVRRLASIPANVLTPAGFAREARKLAANHQSLTCRVLDGRDIAREKMGALLAVAKGSDQSPRFVILEHKGGRAGQKPVVLVGKGITFDSGGLSLKQASMMPEMKGDMTGAAVVMAAIGATAELKLPLNIVGLMPLAENMPSSGATRPSDIVISRKGLTVEIFNTDAEGRLILADALDYANEFDPQAVIDIATLTGGALYVLGYSGAPIMGNNSRLMDRIRAASEATAERVWEMPIWDDFRKTMKSDIADLINSGGKPASTMTAAAFLENFVGNWPWAHIDIAYVDLEPKGRPYIPKGNTGIGLRLLLQLLSNWKKL